MSKFCRKCGATLEEGQKFCRSCGAAVAVANVQKKQGADTGAKKPPVNSHLPVKSKLAAALLAIFLGHWGIHKFYLGQIGMGILYFLLCWFFGISWIFALIDFVIILTMSDESFEQKYHCRVG